MDEMKKISSEVEKIKPSSLPNTEHAHQTSRNRSSLNLHRVCLNSAAIPQVFKRFTEEDDE